MSTESKIFGSVLAASLTGLLVGLHIIDPSQADTIRGMLETGFGLLIALIAVAYGLETLLVKHKAEVAKNQANAVSPLNSVATPQDAPAAEQTPPAV